MTVDGKETSWQPRAATQWTYWPTLFAAVLVALAVPWYLGLLDVDLRAVLWGILGGCVAVALVAQLRSATDEPPGAVRAAPYVLGVVLLSILWYVLGTFRLPTFLILFALPVFGAALVSRGWLEYGIASLGVAGVYAAALVSSSALRWYLQQFTFYPDFLAAWPVAGRAPVAMGVDADQQLLTLAHFATAMVAAAFLASTAARVIEALSRELAAAARSRGESEELARKLLSDAAELEVLAARPTGVLASVNPAFRAFLGADVEAGQTLFDVLAPVYPEQLRALVASEAGGHAGGVLCRVREEHHVLDIEVRPVEIDGRAIASVRVRETASSDLAVAAFEGLGLAILVLGPDGRVVFGSRPFAAVFPGAVSGASAQAALADCHGLPAAWWEIAPRRRAEVRFAVDDELVTAVVSSTDGALGAALTLVHLQREGAHA